MPLNLAIIAYVQYLLQATTKYPDVFNDGIRPVIAILKRRGEANYPVVMEQLYSLIGESCYRDRLPHALATSDRHIALLQEDLLRMTVTEIQQMERHVLMENVHYINTSPDWLRWLGVSIMTFQELNSQYLMMEMFAHDLAQRKHSTFTAYDDNKFMFPD